MSEKDPALRSLEHEVTRLARRLRRVATERARLLDPAVQPTGWSILVTLYRQGAQRQSELCDELRLDKGAVSRQITALAELGLVERTPDPDDRRASTVTLSDDATLRIKRIESDARRWYDGHFDDWSAEEIERVAEDLARYNEVFEHEV
ncbi:MarR family transcriptional regulator [Nocardioidaceae bacterium]|nr:MarR family transcriptional regulator [Nocardioidaceae bacterium]